MDFPVNENVKSNKISSTGHQKNWEIMQRPNSWLRGLEGEESKVKDTGTISNKIIEENFPNLMIELPIKVKEAYRTPNRLDHWTNHTRHNIIKTIKQRMFKGIIINIK